MPEPVAATNTPAPAPLSSTAAGSAATQVTTPAVVPQPAPIETKVPEAKAAEPVIAKRFANPDAKAPETKATEKPVEAAKPEAKADAAKTEEKKPEEWTLAVVKDGPLSEARVRDLEAAAKAEGLSKAQAEKLMSREARLETERLKADADFVVQTGNAWHEQSMTHPEIGGTNAAAAEVNVNKALQAYANEAERKALFDSPFINNPIFRAIMNRVGRDKLPAEDRAPVTGGKSVPAPVSPAERIYGNR